MPALVRIVDRAPSAAARRRVAVTLPSANSTSRYCEEPDGDSPPPLEGGGRPPSGGRGGVIAAPPFTPPRPLRGRPSPSRGGGGKLADPRVCNSSPISFALAARGATRKSV